METFTRVMPKTHLHGVSRSGTIDGVALNTFVEGCQHIVLEIFEERIAPKYLSDAPEICEGPWTELS